MACTRGDAPRVWRPPFNRLERDGESSDLSKAGAVPIAVGVRAGMSGLSERRAAATGWLLIAAATGMAVPAYVQTLSLGEIAVGKAAAPLYALLAVAPAVILTAAGLLARWSHPGSRIGVLLIAEGLAWTVGTLAYSATYIPAASEIAALTGFLGYAIGGHILLSYPTGRLRSRSDRVLVALLYLACGPAIMLAFAFHASYGPGCSICLANAFLITPDDALDVAANATWFAAAGVLIALTGLRSVPRWRAATHLARRSLAGLPDALGVGRSDRPLVRREHRGVLHGHGAVAAARAGARQRRGDGRGGGHPGRIHARNGGARRRRPPRA
jgi:hypothetical protein